MYVPKALITFTQRTQLFNNGLSVLHEGFISRYVANMGSLVTFWEGILSTFEEQGDDLLDHFRGMANGIRAARTAETPIAFVEKILDDDPDETPQRSIEIFRAGPITGYEIPHSRIGVGRLGKDGTLTGAFPTESFTWPHLEIAYNGLIAQKAVGLEYVWLDETHDSLTEAEG